MVQEHTSSTSHRVRRRYRPPPRVHQYLNGAAAVLATVGLTPLDTVSLEVPGRIRRTAVVWVEHDGQRYLVSLAGITGWVRNVRAAGGVAAVVNGRRVEVTLEEVDSENRAAVLLAYASKRACSRSPAYVAREYLGVSEKPTLGELGAGAERYPVFRLRARPADTETSDWPDAVDQLVAPWIWLFPATYLVHFLEEAFGGEGFDRWVGRVAGAPLPRRDFLLLNAVYWVAMAGAVAAARNHRGLAWVVPALGTITSLNGVGHVAGSALTGSYSPGTVSGATLWLPVGALALRRSFDALGARQWCGAVAAGLGILGAVAATARRQTTPPVQ